GQKENRMFSDAGMLIGKTWTLKIDGIGKLEVPSTQLDMAHTELVGAPPLLTSELKSRAPTNTSVIHNVYLEIDKNLSPKDQIHYSQIMLGMIGSGPVFEKDSQPDVQKQKMLDAFIAFYPREGLALQLDGNTYSRSYDEVKASIIKI